jgi:hypothetical protein
MMRWLILFLAGALLVVAQAVADAQIPGANVASQLPPPRSSEIGRYQYYPAAGEMPALIFDTATGCMELIEKFVTDENPKAPIWIRSITDEIITGTPKRCEQTKRPIQ